MTSRKTTTDLILNRKARFNYEIKETWEAGLVLSGAEVKSVRAGKIDLSGAYVVIKNQEAFLINASISPYQPQNLTTHYDPLRSRKLLLKKREIAYLSQKLKEGGLTLIPLKVYNKNGLLKLEIGLAKRQKKFDKREALKKKESRQKIQRAKLEFRI